VTSLPAVPVAVAMVTAAVLTGASFLLPRRVVDEVAVAASVVMSVLCLVVLHRVGAGREVVWFGGWRPRNGAAIGVAFTVDALAAGLASLAAVLGTLALVFTRRHLETERTLFHVLVLVFVGAMVAFAYAGDLFTMFVFFELMGVAAYALTGYKHEERGPLQGSINFAVTNSIGAFLILTGIGLVYGRTGALNLAQLGRDLGHRPADGLVVAGFTFIVIGFLVKAAIVPFHFWLPDAHAVAPTPVSILFSGVMVELGLYAVARVYWTMFAGVPGISTEGLRAVLVGAGVLTAVVGAIVCLAQHHLKRLLAFSTVSHSGLILIAIGLLGVHGIGGAAVYVLGHGLVKGGLFACAGIILHRLGSVDERRLHGAGRALPVTGAVFTLAALGLSGLPPFGTYLGKGLIEDAARPIGYGWVTIVLVVTSAMTGGAALRFGLRVFYGLGESRAPRHEQDAEDDERETTPSGASTTPATMMIPALVLVGAGLLSGLVPGLSRQAAAAADRFTERSGYEQQVLDGAAPAHLHPEGEIPGPKPAGVGYGLLATLGAVLVAAAPLPRRRRVRAVRRQISVLRPALDGLRALHSGHIGDYVAWLTMGTAVFGGLFTLVLRR
jgi:multicomponent Na+:H+ antiporter subunit D